MSCPLTLQLTVSSIPVILSFFFPPHTSLNLTFYYYHHSPAPLSFLSLLFQGRCSDLRQTAASETGGWREDDRNDKRGSRVRPFHQLLFLSLLLCSTLGIFLLSSIHPTSFSAPLSLLKMLHSCCAHLQNRFSLLFGTCPINGIHDCYLITYI